MNKLLSLSKRQHKLSMEIENYYREFIKERLEKCQTIDELRKLNDELEEQLILKNGACHDRLPFHINHYIAVKGNEILKKQIYEKD